MENNQEEKKPKYNSVVKAIEANDFIAATELVNELMESDVTRRKLLTTVQTKEGAFTPLESMLYKNPQRYLDKNKNLKPFADTFIYTLISSGDIDPNERINENENLFFKYVTTGSVPLVKALLDNGTYEVDITATDSSGFNALVYAIWAQEPDMIKYLIEDLKFNVNEKNFLADDRQPLHWACLHLEKIAIDDFPKMEKIINYLVEQGADLNSPDATEYNLTPIQLIPAYEPEDISSPLDEVFAEKCDALFETLKKQAKATKELAEEDGEVGSLGLKLDF